ncbi:hypothetical protein L211DRAFT_865948 [Terfezia boudieri ATCC MYA-4762]|uniref:Uncharacterized protein n=1 Tax=Terfezia boudieri ATCC MYA-4762 TaxID=1051890 RepID=A0A3N4LZD9_9PEZI|nr:hypothetical protein L211DRAFT_865948 [Terfezia boudieri ATCC MYA-4762]
MQNDRSQRQWLALDMPINQYPPPAPERARQCQREPQPWANRGLSYPPPQVPAAEQPCYERREQERNISSCGYVKESIAYPPSDDNEQQTMDSTQKPRVDWLERVPDVQALLSTRLNRRPLRFTESEGTAVEDIVPEPSPVPIVPAHQRLVLAQERRMPVESHGGEGARGRQLGQAHVIGRPRQEPDRPHLTASMAIRNLIEPTSPPAPDAIDETPRPAGSTCGADSEISSLVRRWSAPGATAEGAKQSAPDVGTAPTFHVTGAESNYLYATAGASSRPRLIPGHYYYDTNTSPGPSPHSPSPHTALQCSLEPGYCATSASREQSQDRYRVEPPASLPPAPHGHQYTSGPAAFRPETNQRDSGWRVPLSSSLAVEHSQVYNPGSADCIHGPVESHTYPNPSSNRSSHDYRHKTSFVYSGSQDRATPSASPNSHAYCSGAGSTRRESPQDQFGSTTTSRSSSIATSQYSPGVTVQHTVTPSSAKNLKSTPYYATLRPVSSGSRQPWSQTASWPLDNDIHESPTSLLPEATKLLPSFRRRRGSSRPRYPTSTRSMPNLLYISDAGNPVADALLSHRQTVIAEEPTQIDMPLGLSGKKFMPRTIGTVTPPGHGTETDAVMREAPPLPSMLKTSIDARLKQRAPSEKTVQISSRGADAWRLHAPQETPRRAKSVEHLVGRVSQYPVSAVRDQQVLIRGSKDRNPGRDGIRSSFSLQELETGKILQEMSSGLVEATPAQENIPQPAELVMPAIPGPASSEHAGEMGVQSTTPVQLTIGIESYKNPFVLIDCALALVRYSRSRFFVANGPLMQNNYTGLAETINYLGTEMQRIESTFTGQAMQEWINTVYNVEEYKDLERLTRYIAQRMDEDQHPAEAGTHRRLTNLIRKYVPNGRLGKWLQMMEGALKDISARQAREDPQAQAAQRRRATGHRTKGYRVAGEASGNFFGPGLA